MEASLSLHTCGNIRGRTVYWNICVCLWKALKCVRFFIFNLILFFMRDRPNDNRSPSSYFFLSWIHPFIDHLRQRRPRTLLTRTHACTHTHTYIENIHTPNTHTHTHTHTHTNVHTAVTRRTIMHKRIHMITNRRRRTGKDPQIHTSTQT